MVRDGRVAVVHRPRYDDWSLPKGKLDPGETWEQAALREIEEETGLRCRLEDELETTHYFVGDRPKPGSSNAITRWLAASRSCVRESRSPPAPWRQTSGDPSPASR